MPQPEATPAGPEVLTLAEAAAYLRVTEVALGKLAAGQAIPSQQIDGEWRFLKRALNGWLTYGRAFEHHPPVPYFMGMFDHPAFDKLLRLLEKRIDPTPDEPAPKRGSKQRVMKHAGIFADDGDLAEQLARLEAIRDAEGGE